MTWQNAIEKHINTKYGAEILQGPKKDAPLANFVSLLKCIDNIPAHYTVEDFAREVDIITACVSVCVSVSGVEVVGFITLSVSVSGVEVIGLIGLSLSVSGVAVIPLNKYIKYECVSRRDEWFKIRNF